MLKGHTGSDPTNIWSASSLEADIHGNDPDRISRGAVQYADMCSGCHLAPGMKQTEISRGLYPRAPELRRKTNLTPAEQFWIVKHGVKMTRHASLGRHP
jgi:Cytochrome C oxidase, cbb3-type, subunit III